MLTGKSLARPSFFTARPNPPYPVRRQLSPVFEPPLILSARGNCQFKKLGCIHCVDKCIALGLSEVKLIKPINEIDVQSGGLEEVDQVIIERSRMGFGGWELCLDLRQINKKDSLYCEEHSITFGTGDIHFP
jgi:hypothetical protein